jgi:photosystem II stability/assembly factor-like uncharacterized protein
MKARVVMLIVALLVAGVGTGLAAKSTETETEPTFDEQFSGAMKFRLIGPYRGGRVTAVSGVGGDFETYYMGSTGGGVWKTTDAGVSWKNISDEHFAAASVGAIAVAESDPNVIFVGTGSACPRGNVSPGIGLYRSTDAGKSWTHVGLDDAGQISRIRIHPQNPDLVYVAALGHIFGPNEERGVFRSTDGGESWEKVLFVSDSAGAVDLAMSPGNPRLLFAGIWEAERKPWTMISGGENGGLYRSTDGGDTWDKLTEGLPEGMTGRIGVTVSAANPDRVWALIEADKGGLFRSEDGGDKFRLINSDRNFRQRAWYYTHVFADPQDPETVYILNVGMWRSVDGGKSFSYIRAPHGDHHDLWLQPKNSQILINANDGGANVSFNGGKTWSSQANQPTAEMYRVTVDDQFPYRVYGCQQDNSCVSLPSRTSSSGIARHNWWVIGGCESGHVAMAARSVATTTPPIRSARSWPIHSWQWARRRGISNIGFSGTPRYGSLPTTRVSSTTPRSMSTAPPTRARAGRSSVPTSPATTPRNRTTRVASSPGTTPVSRSTTPSLLSRSRPRHPGCCGPGPMMDGCTSHATTEPTGKRSHPPVCPIGVKST